MTLWEGHFDYFQGRKSRFQGFLKVGLVLFRSSIVSDFPLLWGTAVALQREKPAGFLLKKNYSSVDKIGKNRQWDFTIVCQGV